MLDYPYVGVDEFKAHPHYLDLGNLLVGKPQDWQDSTIYNALLFASQWADDEIDMPLGAHVRAENSRVRADSRGRIKYHPEHAPALSLTGLAVGPAPDQLDTSTGVQAWIEQDGRLIVAYGPAGAPGLNALQFGYAPPMGELLARWTYVAGYPATQLAADAAASNTVIVVRSPIGIVAGTVLRLWTPGGEEAVTVQLVAGSTLTLTAPLRGPHLTGMSCSALPPTARLAVIKMTMAKLLRPGPLAEQAGRFAGAPSPSAATGRAGAGGAGSSYGQAACALLANFKRVR